MAEGQRASKKSKRPDKRPAKIRYWMSRHLERNKVKNLMKSGYTKAEALKYWHSVRKGRVKDNFLKYA